MSKHKWLSILNLTLFLSSSGMTIPITLTQDYCKTLVESENKKHKNRTPENEDADDNAVHYRVRSNPNAVSATIENGFNMKNLQGIGGTMALTGSNSGVPSISINGGNVQANATGGQNPFTNTSGTTSQAGSNNMNSGSGTINSATNSMSTSNSNTTVAGFSVGGAGGAGGAGANSPGGNGGASSINGGNIQANATGGQFPLVNTPPLSTRSRSVSENVNTGSGTVNSVTNSTSTSTSNTTTTGISTGGAAGAGGAGANSPGGNGGASALQGGVAASNSSNVAANGGVMIGSNSIASTSSGAAAGAGSVVAGQGGTAVSIQQNGVTTMLPGGYLNFGPINNGTNGTVVNSNGHSPDGIPIMDNANMRAVLAMCLDLYYTVK